MVYATTVDVLLPAAFGALGTVTGALIARSGALSQRRAEKDDEVRMKAERVAVALEDLEDEPENPKRMRSASLALQSLGFAAIAAGIDSRLALDPVSSIRHFIRYYPDTRREQVSNHVRDYVAELVTVVREVPYWRRRGRFMHPQMKKAAERLR
jgi:hypothetical protein